MRRYREPALNHPAKLASERTECDASAASPPIRIEPVHGRRDLETFIRLPNRLYRDCPSYVAPLLMERRDSRSVTGYPMRLSFSRGTICVATSSTSAG